MMTLLAENFFAVKKSMAGGVVKMTNEVKKEHLDPQHLVLVNLREDREEIIITTG
jgi:hypothetical protein